MPKRKKRKEKDTEQQPIGPRAVWSGSISFGLLNLPVDLFPAHRTQAVSLRLVDDEGQPLRRRYYCEEHDKALGNDEIVRGYAVAEGEYVMVTDDELEGAAPDKSRDIDLGKFVAVEEIDPIYFDRSYYLTPEAGAARAYTLLAQTMEKSGKAGIATFVMRDKEHIVALMAAGGVLRAATLRFADEVRDTEAIGLEPPADAEPDTVREYARAIDAASNADVDRRELADRYTERLREHVSAKVEQGTDIVEAAAEDEPVSRAEIVDLMDVLKQRLNPAAPEGPARTKRTLSRGADGQSLAELSKDELYERAKALDVPGRSKFSKRQLVDAIRKASA